MPDLDVVIVNYNAGEHLLRCVASVRAAAGATETIIRVIDNDSQDDSIDRLAEADPDVRIIRNLDNVGFGSAVNQGIAAGTAPWVLALNPDAEISSGDLATLLDFASGHDSAGAVGVLVRDPDGTIYPSARRVPTLAEAAGHALIGPFRRDNRWSRAYTMEGWDRTSAREVDWVSGSSMLLRRNALERTGGFDPGYFMYAEDADLCTRLRADGWEVWFTPAVTVVHDHGLSTRGSRRMIWEHSRSIQRYFSKHIATGWKRILLPVSWVVLWIRAVIVSRRMWRP